MRASLVLSRIICIVRKIWQATLRMSDMRYREKPGIYNILIMEEKQTIIACGAGTTTKRLFPEENRIERAENVKNVEQYIERIDEMIARKDKLLSM